MPFELRVTDERPPSPETDELRRYLHSFFMRSGILGQGSDPTLLLDLFCNRFLARPEKFWSADELVELHSTNKVTLKSNLDRLRQIDILQEGRVTGEGQRAIKGYRLRYGSLADAFSFTVLHSGIILSRYRKHASALNKQYRKGPATHGGSSASASSEKVTLEVRLRDVEHAPGDVLESLGVAMGYLHPGMGRGTSRVGERLLTEVFLARDRKWWTVEEIGVQLDAPQATVNRYLGRLRSFYLIEETDSKVEEGHRGKAKRLYRLRFSNLTRAFDFLGGHVKVALDEYMEEAERIEKMARG